MKKLSRPLNRAKLSKIHGGQTTLHCRCQNGMTVTAVADTWSEANTNAYNACGQTHTSCVGGN
ncbi:hypothetical protein ACM39_15620 [Chryseobacterium sp. FH2]|uniref:hypothetical protein n=1 Tax=Chryseobacterium sp. FH2 TaxID=1674291 RepID=UPI00065ACAAC|nr:hypothetical protein [Chryseobacterium sp. FH2]KMQ67198.1 hypothetical protein ACM39_15620 [Chryseobacterium sp. FH2]